MRFLGRSPLPFGPIVLSTCACLAACASGGDPAPSCETTGTCDERVHDEPLHEIAARPPLAPNVPRATFESARPEPRRGAACADGYATMDCRRPGLPVDILEARPCCGFATRQAMCCATAGQPCSDELGQTCCAGLHCGPGCVCE